MSDLYHEYWGSDEYDNRSAKVFRNDYGFFVEMYSGKKLVESRPLYNHSERYSEDCAENWVMGVIP